MSDEINGRCNRSEYGDGRLRASDLLAARLEERAMIVAWLREQAEEGRSIVSDMAYEIEEGEHHK